MTKSRSNRGRHRRNRDRPIASTGPDVVQANGEAVPQPLDRLSQRTEGVAEPHVQPPRAPREPDPRRGQRPPQGQGAAELPSGPRSGPPRNNRRRQQRRPQITPMPSDVLKPKAPISGPVEPIRKRSLAEMDGPDGPVLGCPMLTRTRMELPVTGGQTAPRCALAWALHSETEASYCLETPNLVNCWKAHPERLDEIKARLSERAAAD